MRTFDFVFVQYKMYWSRNELKIIGLDTSRPIMCSTHGLTNNCVYWTKRLLTLFLGRYNSLLFSILDERASTFQLIVCSGSNSRVQCSHRMCSHRKLVFSFR